MTTGPSVSHHLRDAVVVLRRHIVGAACRGASPGYPADTVSRTLLSSLHAVVTATAVLLLEQLVCSISVSTGAGRCGWRRGPRKNRSRQCCLQPPRNVVGCWQHAPHRSGSVAASIYNRIDAASMRETPLVVHRRSRSRAPTCGFPSSAIQVTTRHTAEVCRATPRQPGYYPTAEATQPLCNALQRSAGRVHFPLSPTLARHNSWMAPSAMEGASRLCRAGTGTSRPTTGATLLRGAVPLPA